MEPAPVGEGIKLRLAEVLERMGHIEPQLAQQFQAAVGHQLRGVVGAAKGTAAITAQFRRQQRLAGILAIGGDQE